jgi:hypothetical protein
MVPNARLLPNVFVVSGAPFHVKHVLPNEISPRIARNALARDRAVAGGR